MSFKKNIYLFTVTLSLFLLSILFVACSEEQIFTQNDISKTSIRKKEIPKEELPKKISMLFITQAHCPSCDKLENTMKLKKPAQLIKKYFEKKTIYLGEKIPENLAKPNGTPTVYFLGYKDELLIQPMIGEKDEASLIMFLEDALLEFKTLYDVDLTLTKEDNNETDETNSSST